MINPTRSAAIGLLAALACSRAIGQRNAEPGAPTTESSAPNPTTVRADAAQPPANAAASSQAEAVAPATADAAARATDTPVSAADASSSGSNTGAFDEEVVVRGRSRAMLRLQIQLAEEAVYDRFNEINSTDEYDIVCRREILTGSRIPRRVCQPNLWRTALRRAGVETARSMQGSYALSASQFQAEALYKQQLMADELRQLAREDKELQEAVVHLAQLTGATDDPGGRRTLPATAADRVVNADDQELPYGASIMANVWVRRKPWNYALTHRIFTIANVFGTIESIGLDCEDQSDEIVYEQGAEWSLPDGWTSCELTVAAEPGTTFSLYEFE